MRFIADTMLGTLAKWLRAMGFDVVYARDMADDEILRFAAAEDRIVISRDRQLCASREGSVLLSSIDLDSQILSVLKLFPADEKLFLSRCLVCNFQLAEAARTEAYDKVPENVLERHDRFWRCPGCGKFYWAGTHYEAMMRKARELSASRNNLR